MPVNDIKKFSNKSVTQRITFSHGNKGNFEGIKPETIKQGQFTHFELEDGRLILINYKNVDYIEVIK